MSGPPSQPPGADAARRPRRAALLTLACAGALWLVLALGPAPSAPAGAAADPQGPASAPAHASEAAAEATQLVADVPPPSEALPLPACAYGSEPAPMAAPSEWRYTLLDTTFRLEPDYVPPDLVSLPQALAHLGSGRAGEGHRLRAVAVGDLVALFEEAEAAGVQLAVQSAYRSYAYQESTFAHWVEVDGYEVALATSARAGHSEHQLGTVVDLRSRHGVPAWDLDDWAETPEGAWVAANAHRFGFVMSYPKDREGESCYAYEPWHYRYVGRELAGTIHEAGETPRAFLWRLAEERRLSEEPGGEAGP